MSMFLAALLLLLGCFHASAFLDEDLQKVNSRVAFGTAMKHYLESPDSGVSKCAAHVLQYAQALLKGQMWALTMFDASAKVPSGIAEGNFFELGSFDQCLAVESEATSPEQTVVYGQYCIASVSLKLNKSVSALQNHLLMQPLDTNYGRQLEIDTSALTKFGLCIPNSCSASEMQLIFQKTGIPLVVSAKSCQSKASQPALDTGAIAALSFLGILVWVMVSSTVYDATIQYIGKEPLHPVMLAFSVMTNGKSLFSLSKSKNQIGCLNGIRVISAMWIVLGHSITLRIGFPMRNIVVLPTWARDTANMYMMSATLSVDTFFLLSGLVIAYVFMMVTSKGVRFNIFQYYLHRYLRLTPVLCALLLIHTTLVPYMGSGPLYHTTGQEFLVESCTKYWWRVLLYIQNFFGSTEWCINQSWYSSVDMQLFILSPILLIPLRLWPKGTIGATVFLTACSMVACFVTGWLKEFKAYPVVTSLTDFFRLYYTATHTRAAPWLIGIIFGYYIFQIKQQRVNIKINSLIAAVTMLTCTVIMVTCLYIGHNLVLTEYDRLANSLHLALVKPVWAIAIGCIIVICVLDYGGPVNWFLSLPVFQILSKLTYTIYMVHYQVIMIVNAQMRTAPYFVFSRIFYDFWSDFCVSVFVALLFTLAFESPVIFLEKRLLGKKPKKEAKKRTDLENCQGGDNLRPN